jgi:glycosyltransferase involved in cell wall biosynthesis
VVWNIRHSLHDLTLEKRLTRVIIRLCAPLSHLAQAVIYNARVSAAQHERLGYADDRTVVIPNGFDGEQFKPRPDGRRWLCRELSIDPGSVIVGMIARDHPMKDPGNLVRAVGALRQEGRPVEMVIAGRGLDAANRGLAADIRAAGLGPHVTLLGERRDVAAVVAGFDIAALPSAWGEGFPNVLGEAMASGVPSVATEVGDSAWVIGPHGIVFPPRRHDALAAALARLIDLGPDGRRQLGAAARARVLEKFSLHEVVRQYEALHERVGQTPGWREPMRAEDPEASLVRPSIQGSELAGDRRHG